MAHDGQLTIVVSAVPEDTSALADRLGRYLPADTEPVSQELEEGIKGRAARRARAEREAERARIAARDEERARQPWGVTARRRRPVARPGSTDVRRRDAGQRQRQPAVRRHPPGRHRPPRSARPRRRPRRPCASPTPRTSTTRCPGGWQGRLDERGRGLSGGQRQRVVLARAIAADAPVLVLVEPTSAVDAHTEARIAERVADVRRGRTTVVTTVSPLWLHHADRIVLVHEGRAIAEGTHEDLLLDSPDYRRGRHARVAMDDPARTETVPRNVLTNGWEWTTVTDLLATSPDTWRDRAHEPPVDPDRADPARARGRSPTGSPPCAAGTRCASAGRWRTTPSPASPTAAGRSPTTTPCWRSSASCCASAGAIFVLLVVLNGLAAATGLVVPRLLGSLINRTVAGDAASSLNTLALLDRRRRLRPGAADVPGPADVDGLRPGPAVVGARVHRPDHPARCRSAASRAPAAATWSPA